MNKTLYKLKDGDFSMEITTSPNWKKNLIKFEPAQLGTELNRKNVIELIIALSNWLNETEPENF